jgi:bis(5'-nucleosyl)-tetraphosphatase (symmetrical)
MKRTIIIGDVHGCFAELLELLSLLEVSLINDRLIFLGDLVHKGPESAEVLNFVFEKKYEVILGNHDDFFLNALQGKTKPYEEFNDILQRLKMEKEKLIKWYLSCPLSLEGLDWIAIHGGLDPKGKVLMKLDKEILLNLRYWNTLKNKPSYYNGHDGIKPGCVPWYDCLEEEVYQNKRIFYGHWAKIEVQMNRNGKIIGLDTGCCYGGKLSGYIIEENKLIQVSSKQKKQFNY